MIIHILSSGKYQGTFQAFNVDTWNVANETKIATNSKLLQQILLLKQFGDHFCVTLIENQTRS